MKNILVPTDFSAPAKEAALYAAGLARQTGARVILSHIYHPVAFLEDEEVWLSGEDLERNAQAKMDHLARELHLGFGISVSRLLRPGFVADEILFLAQRVKAEVVVVGLPETNLKPNQGFGHITTEILQKANFPILCVPSGTSFADISCVAWLRPEEEEFLSFPGSELLRNLGVKQVALLLKPAGVHSQLMPVALDPAPENEIWVLAEPAGLAPFGHFPVTIGPEKKVGEPEEKVTVYQAQLLVCSLPHFRRLLAPLHPGHHWLQDKMPFLVLPEAGAY